MQGRRTIETMLQQVGLHEPARRMTRRVRGGRAELARLVRAAAFRGRAIFESPILGIGDGRHSCDVICLPDERPRPLLRALAGRGHRVFCIAAGSSGGKNARVRQIEPGMFDVVLPGASEIEVRRQPPAPIALERMANGVGHLRTAQRITSAVVVAPSARWTPLAELLRERFGWPTVGDSAADGPCEAFEAAVCNVFSPASIVIVTYNNLALNRACLASIFRETDHPNYEIIVVDNASTDGTAEWLAQEAAREPRLKAILNRDNRGYAAGNNQGLRAARGDFLCLLNNDTVVARGWLATLIGHLRGNPALGMVGPVSNMVGNEAIVPVVYKDVSAMPFWAERHCRRHAGEFVPMEMLGFFCVVMRRAVYEDVGELDERFGIGCFEDDDYCRRVRAAGYAMGFVRDAFVHHACRASFKLLGDVVYQKVYEENRRKYDEKWNSAETPVRKRAG